MLAPTHSVFGIFLTLIILAVFGVQWGLHWSIILFAVLGAIIPDIDHPKSIIGKFFYPVSSIIERKFGHRTITHSLIGWTIATVIFSFIIIIPSLAIGHWQLGILPWRWLAAFSIGYFSHLILDMFNKRGSQMFWPDPGRDVIPRNHKFRPEAGAKIEVLIFIIIFALMFLAFPISKYGIGSSLRWLLATPGSAIEEFKTLKTHTYIEFKGIMSETRVPINGRAEILDVKNKRLVILLKDGHVFSLSDELSADIIASHVRVIKTQIPIKTERREFKNKTRDYLLSQIPNNALISGIVHLPQDMKIEYSSYQSMYKPIEQKGDDLILSYASKVQIKSLALDQFFALQLKKDRTELSKLLTQVEKINFQIKEIESTKGLTPLGKKILQSTEDVQKQKVQLSELRSQLNETNIKIEELKIKMKSRKFVFSGEVYIRQ